jgi:murein DD-endopeptidase MepM/ murein hydrolase activator NlpD
MPSGRTTASLKFRQRLKGSSAFTLAIIPASAGFKREWRVSYATVWFFLAIMALAAWAILFALFKKPVLEADKRISEEVASAWLARWEILQQGKDRITANLDELQKIGDDYYRTIFQTAPDLGDIASTDSAKQQSAKILPLVSVMQLITAREEAFISMPIGIAVRSNQITSLYGRRIDPFGLETDFHTGIDFAGGVGAPIYATADGVVASAADEGTTGLGKNVRLQHKFGIITVYAHLNEIAVHKDQKVRRGDLIGYVGTTGRSTGPHLHYEIRVRSVEPDNYYELTYNPMPFIREKL